VVTGFRGGSWNAYSDNFTIRNADAHAWAEIFDETSESWLRADPLAPEAAAQTQEVRGEAAIAARLDRSWKARLDSLRVFWYRRIVSFDQRSQAETLKAVKEATQASGLRLRAALTAWVDGLKAWLAQPWDVRRAAEVLAWAAGLAAAGWFWRGWGRRWWRDLRPTRGRRHEDPVRREAGRWLVRLAAAGPPGPETARAAADLQRLRFGPRPTWPQPEAVFRRARQAWRAAGSRPGR
jgi:hypothetical protein